MYYKSSGLLLSVLLMGGCGGGGSDVDEFAVADGFASYTGVSDLAYLDEGNAGAFLSTLFGPGLESPDLTFRGGAVTGSVELSPAQNALLHRSALRQTSYQQRVVDVSESEACEDGGRTDFSGELDDSAGTAKLNLDYIDCQIGDTVTNGKALALLANNSGSFSELDEITFSYHGLEARSLSSGEIMVVTGTIKEVENLNTGAITKTDKVHRRIKGSNKQSLIDLVSQAASASGSVEISGDVYQGLYGRAELITLQRMVYDDGVPVAGGILMLGEEDSKVKVTALGQQYDEVADETGIMLQVEVDEDGDGQYESLSVIDTDDL